MELTTTENQLKKILIIHQQLSEKPTLDEQDVLDQIEYVKEALKQLGYSYSVLPFSTDIAGFMVKARAENPYCIFNMVESFENKGELLFMAGAILDLLKYPYTGAKLEALYVTTNKVLTKKLLKLYNLPTPEWFSINETEKLKPDVRYILKPISEDGSVGIDEDSVFTTNDHDFLTKIKNYDPNNWFIEEYIDGREFNISLISSENNTEPEIFPLAEIIFDGYGENKLKVIGYTAKWMDGSYECENTYRNFQFKPEEQKMLDLIKDISINTWLKFGLKGYVRIDFRVDTAGNPYILEINANPCINLNSGFPAAGKRAGYSYEQIIQRIINDAFKN